MAAGVRQLSYRGPGDLQWIETAEPRLDSDRAALIRPLAVATCDLDALIIDGASPFQPPFALERDPGAAVLVVGGYGPGSIGLYAAAIAVALGSRRTLYVDEDERRSRVATGLGAEVFNDRWPRRLGPFPITVDACGRPEGLELALRSTAPDGTCTSTAIYLNEQPVLPLLEMYEKVVTFRTGRCHARPQIPAVLDLVERGALHPELVTTRVVDWSDAAEALAELDWIKLVIGREAAA